MKFKFDMKGSGYFIGIGFTCSYCNYTYEITDLEAIKRLINKKKRICPLCERN